MKEMIIKNCFVCKHSTAEKSKSPFYKDVDCTNKKVDQDVINNYSEYHRPEHCGHFKLATFDCVICDTKQEKPRFYDSIWGYIVLCSPECISQQEKKEQTIIDTHNRT